MKYLIILLFHTALSLVVQNGYILPDAMVGGGNYRVNGNNMQITFDPVGYAFFLHNTRNNAEIQVNIQNHLYANGVTVVGEVYTVTVGGNAISMNRHFFTNHFVGHGVNTIIDFAELIQVPANGYLLIHNVGATGVFCIRTNDEGHFTHLAN